MTTYLVMRAVGDEDTWEEAATLTAASGQDAIRQVVAMEDGAAEDGGWLAVATRYVTRARASVEVKRVVSVSVEGEEMGAS